MNWMTCVNTVHINDFILLALHVNTQRFLQGRGTKVPEGFWIRSESPSIPFAKVLIYLRRSQPTVNRTLAPMRGVRAQNSWGHFAAHLMNHQR